MVQEKKGFKPYEKVAHIIETNKEIDPRLTGLWYLIGKKIVCDNIEEDSEECNNIVELFTTDPIALKVMAELCKCDFRIANIILKYSSQHPENDMGMQWKLSEISGLIVGYKSSYVATYQERKKEASIFVNVWNIRES